MSNEIQFAQKHFREAIQAINPREQPGLHSLSEGLNFLAQAVAVLESEIEKLRHPGQSPRT